MKTVVPVLALALAGFAFATPAAVAQPASEVYLDFDGDGRVDRAWIESVAGNPVPTTQVLSAQVGAERYRAYVPFASWSTDARPMRVVDLDGDGREEVVVAESVGANTTTSSVWGFNGRLRALTTADGGKLVLAEGGGLAARSLFGCETDGDGDRALVTVSTQLDWDANRYVGERVVHAVAGGVASEVSRTPVDAAPGDPVFDLDVESCR